MKPCTFTPMTQGQCVKTVEVGGFTVVDSFHGPGVKLARHAHERATLCFVLRGAFCETLGARPQECGPHSLIIKPAGEPHADHYGPQGARCIIIEMDNQRMESIRNYAPVQNRSVHVHGGKSACIATRLYQELHQMDAASLLVIEGLTMELLGETWCNRGAGLRIPSRSLKLAEEYVREHFDQPIGLTEVAKAANVHPGYLARLFRARHKCTVGDFLRKVRLDWASEQLSQSNASIAEIAVTSGFYDQSHLTNTFRHHTGLTPAEFRRASRADFSSS